MARVVVVTSAELDRKALEGVVEPGDDVHVVAAAVDQSFLQWLANDEDEAREQAARVAEDVAETAPGETASVEVKPDPPRQLVLDAIAEHDPDRVVVAVRAGDDPSWLEQGELDRLPSEIAGVPVTRVTLAS